MIPLIAIGSAINALQSLGDALDVADTASARPRAAPAPDHAGAPGKPTFHDILAARLAPATLRLG